MSNDPVSWLLIEHGWNVVGPSGEELGSVSEVVGDTGDDIFNGLSVAAGLLRRPRYVPAEQVARIVEGRIELAIGQDEFDRLGDYDEPSKSEEVRADTTDL
jgi:uncharacterized protein YrrD